MAITNSELAANITALLNKWIAREKTYADWQAGPANGGPNGDGVYTLTDYAGNQTQVKSPARLAADVDQLVTSAKTYSDSASSSATAAASSASAASTSESNASTSESNAFSYKDLASKSATAAANSATYANTRAGDASTSATNAAASETNAATSETNAATSESNAAASASAASTSETNAAASEQLAQKWADNPLGTVVANGEYSAYHWALKAQQYVTGTLRYKGAWDASTGAYPASPTQGDFWKVSKAGTTNSVSYAVGDQIIWDGTVWDKIDNSELVTSVAGRIGDVVLSAADISGLSAVATSGAYSDLSGVPDLSIYAAKSWAALQNGYTVTSGDGLQWRMALEDGMGRVNFYWNSDGGPSPTYLAASEPAFNLNMDNSSFAFNYAPGGNAGASISWTSILSGDASGRLTTKGNNILDDGNGNFQVAGNASFYTNGIWLNMNGAVYKSNGGAVDTTTPQVNFRMGSATQLLASFWDGTQQTTAFYSDYNGANPTFRTLHNTLDDGTGGVRFAGSLYLPNSGGGGPAATGHGIYLQDSGGNDRLTLYVASDNALRLTNNVPSDTYIDIPNNYHLYIYNKDTSTDLLQVDWSGNVYANQNLYHSGGNRVPVVSVQSAQPSSPQIGDLWVY